MKRKYIYLTSKRHSSQCSRLYTSVTYVTYKPNPTHAKLFPSSSVKVRQHHKAVADKPQSQEWVMRYWSRGGHLHGRKSIFNSHNNLPQVEMRIELFIGLSHSLCGFSLIFIFFYCFIVFNFFLGWLANPVWHLTFVKDAAESRGVVYLHLVITESG